MSQLLYLANARIPSEKANAYQMVQMCEAFAQVGQTVTLVIPRRINDQPELQGVTDLFAYYGVEQNFRVVKLPCLDLIWLMNNRLGFLLQTATFILSLLVWLPFQRYDTIFTRDHFVLGVVSLFIPRQKLIYEVHNKFRSGRGQRLQSWLLGRVGLVVSLTGTMAEQLIQLGANSERLIVAHDGIRLERFAAMPTQAESRQALGLPADAFVACYAGRLHTMNMSKGLDVFIDAASQVKNIMFLLVGGPEEGVIKLRDLWQAADLPATNFVAVGTVPPTEIPRYLAAADVCLITSPHNDFFAHETSPMKLFEYMLAGKAILASDLPSTREVVQHGESAYLVPPSDVTALAQALTDLQVQPALREGLGRQARQVVQQYSWQERAKWILKSRTSH